jgi:hypothetical protein
MQNVIDGETYEHDYCYALVGAELLTVPVHEG